VAELGEWELDRVYGPWSASTPSRVARLLGTAAVTWWIAGGWSLEPEPTRPARPHDDVDVAVLRRDVDALREHLAGWHLWEAENGSLRPLLPGDEPSPSSEQLWVRRDAYSPWVMDLLLTPADGADWVFKRDPRIRRPLATVACRRADGVAYQAPEVTLLLKARAAAEGRSRPKDDADLARALPGLALDARRWLRQALEVAEPGHPWLSRLN